MTKGLEVRHPDLKQDPRVNNVVPDRTVEAFDDPPPTGIDRIDVGVE